MLWQVAADITLGLSIPLVTAFLYLTGRILRKHVWMMAWGFTVGATWEFSFYFLGDTIHTMRTEWPLPIITLHFLHTCWDAWLFIIGYWLCQAILKTPDCCTRFRWTELAIMMLWGSTQEFIVELLGNGVIWEYQVHSWNPVWITIGEQDYTILPQLIWLVAPIIYYLGFIRINRGR
jgi:hypothetical protein